MAQLPRMKGAIGGTCSVDDMTLCSSSYTITLEMTSSYYNNYNKVAPNV